jgi:hypothetical protein
MNRDPHLSDSQTPLTNPVRLTDPVPLTNPEDEITGLPALPTWRRVYWFVLVVFVTYVLLLAALSRVFT